MRLTKTLGTVKIEMERECAPVDALDPRELINEDEDEDETTTDH
jgi:hypothetical protein